jgi:gas vesicle protein
MVKELVATELAKFAVQKLNEVKLDDAVRAVKTITRATAGGGLLIPGLGAFGVGLAVGAGVGMLLAPRAGRETRAALRDKARSSWRAIERRLGRTRVVVSDAEVHAVHDVEAATAEAVAEAMPAGGQNGSRVVS